MRARAISFQEFYSLLLEYKNEYGDCNVPYSHVTSDGIKLGVIVESFRTGARRISKLEKGMLDEIHFVWCIKHQCSFDELLTLLEEYVKEYGNCDVRKKYVAPNGIKLGYIVYNIRYGRRKINCEERLLLDLLGFRW